MTVTASSSEARRLRVLRDLETSGFAVLEGAMVGDEFDIVRGELSVALTGAPFGRNEFEGHRTKRIYALLDEAPETARLAEHRDVLAIADDLLLRNYLLSAHLAIELHPGETVQPLHYDDGFYAVPRPRPAFGLSVIWAFDDFTADNGATEVVPGSHALGGESPDAAEAVPIELAAGSALLMLGTTWHRGGSNQTERPRLAVTSQYCEPWARQQEQMMLSIAPQRARTLSSRLRQMIGYSIHPPFMGHTGGMHPERLLQLDAGESDQAARAIAGDFWRQRPGDTWTRGAEQ